MKTVIGYGFIILGFVCLFRYPNLGSDGAETFGALIGIGLIAFVIFFMYWKSTPSGKYKFDSILSFLSEICEVPYVFISYFDSEKQLTK